MTPRADKNFAPRSVRSDAKGVASSAKRPASKRRANSTGLPLEATAAATKRKPGRPKGTGKYGEPTKAIRFPVSLLGRLDSFIKLRGYVLRLYSDQIQAGFPSPAEENAPFEPYDLGERLIPNPESTFLIRATGESMRGAGVFPGDVLIVDRSLEPSDGDVVVAAINGEFTVKRLVKEDGRVELRPENKRFRPILVTDDMDFIVWGVVKTVIHSV